MNAMTAFWTEADYDDHELVQLVRDPKSGLTAIIAIHSTHLGPGAGGTSSMDAQPSSGTLAQVGASTEGGRSSRT